jgi:hypothetical protein
VPAETHHAHETVKAIKAEHVSMQELDVIRDYRRAHDWPTLVIDGEETSPLGARTGWTLYGSLIKRSSSAACTSSSDVGASSARSFIDSSNSIYLEVFYAEESLITSNCFPVGPLVTKSLTLTLRLIIQRAL